MINKRHVFYADVANKQGGYEHFKESSYMVKTLYTVTKMILIKPMGWDMSGILHQKRNI